MIDELPDAPDPATDAPTVFNAKAAATVLAQKRMVTQMNAALAAFGALAAGGAFAIAMMVDASSTAAGDPGVGKLRFNSANQGAATAMYVDLAAIGGVDITAKLAQFAASTSTVKGTLRLVQLNDQTRELVCNVTAVASPSGYRTLTVSPISSSAAAPFADGATVLMFFQRNGDRGEQGPAVSVDLPVMIVREERAAGTNGGTFAVGENTRNLNTVSKNTINGASLSNSAITLPAGTYRITGSAVAQGASTQPTQHKIYLTNSAFAVVLVGTSELAPAGCVTRSEIDGHLTLASSTTLTLKHVNATGLAVDNTGMGRPSNAYSTVEVYAQLTIEKVA